MLGLMDGPHTQDTKGGCPIWPVTYPPCLALVFDSLFGIHFCRLYVVHCCFYIIFYPVYHFPLHKQTTQACTSLSPPSAQKVKTGMYQSIIYPSTNSQNRNVPIYHLQHSQNRNVPEQVDDCVWSSRCWSIKLSAAGEAARDHCVWSPLWARNLLYYYTHYYYISMTVITDR